MKPFKWLRNKDISKVSGGGSALDKYLKKIKDHKTKIIDYGEGSQLDLNSKVEYGRQSPYY